MSPSLPDGEEPPIDGSLPPTVAPGSDQRAFGIYVHVPFCRVRCGYCDFNTYAPTELGGTSQSDYPGAVHSELELAARALSDAGLARRPVSTVFFGGGTPTVLSPSVLIDILADIDRQWGLAAGAEITVEANPETVDAAALAALAAGGFTRVSIGMQSAVQRVLDTLDRRHDPAKIPGVVAAARAAGLALSLDLIYGTPGESRSDFRRSLAAAIDLDVDHISAYALTLEPGTRMYAQIRRGTLVGPDPEDQADKYEDAEDMLSAAGFSWYEISNWARHVDDRCRHNLAYWRGEDWWGIGPGAHSHFGTGAGGVRWWNVKHPASYAARLADGRSPAAGREYLSADQAALESLMLDTRLADGMAMDRLSASGRRAVPALIADGLLDGVAAIGGRVVLTLRGRLLADTVVQALGG